MTSEPYPKDAILDVVVHARRDDTTDIAVFELRRADGGDLPPFTAGAHIDVHLGDGLVRQYSLCNPGAERDRYVIGVLREKGGRGGSARMHGLRQGDRLRIGVPRNAFALDEGGTRVLLVAGGIGITPILAMARHLQAADREFELHYFARSASTAAFLSELRHAALADRVRLHFDDAGGSIARVLPLLHPDRGSHVYVCGPSGFIDCVRQGALAAGFDAGAVRFERFAAEPSPATAADDAEAAFEVEAARSGVRVTVEPGQSIAKALEEAGLQVLTSCEQGLCGVCLTNVLEGVPDHRDEFQTDEEKARNDKMTICCSRAMTPLLRLDI